MTRITPPRPVDITEVFPELTEHSATATRLHPRPGTPSAADSSVGGPLLWPAGETWPVCPDGGGHHFDRLLRPATVHRSRAIYAAVYARARETGTSYTLTDEERTQLPGFDFSEPHTLANQPIPLIPVAQLYRRDVPDFAGPEDTDLLQVLWCPLDHPEEGYNPRIQLYWRHSADIDRPLGAAPEPPVVDESYLPTPCLLQPEQIREYQYGGLLPVELNERITAWEEENSDDEDGPSYQIDLSLAPGWKVGGFANWSLTDPQPMNCAECGAAGTLLLAADSSEWHGPGHSWRPTHQPTERPDPTGISIGRGYALYIFRCPVSFDHPTATAMQ